MTAASASAPALARPAPGGGRTSPNLWIYVLLVGGLVLMVGPFLWMLLGSIKPQADFLRAPTLMPSTPTTDNYSGSSISSTSRGSSSTRRSSRWR